ncbi:Uncharacterised protein [Mycobacteroides abscessus subsp. massiliense]|nr:Uncharacterised protein [Mycobacteroides abscessus subsp. massiliense]
MLMNGLTAEGVVLKVEEPSGTLYIGHAIRRRALQAGKYFTTGQRPFELADELVKVVLYDSI